MGNNMKLKFLLATTLTGLLMVPHASAAPGVQPWNRPCIKFYAEWKKKPNHKAFAVVTSDYEQSCGGSWGNASKAAAEESAKKWCRKSSPGLGCAVTDSQ